MEWADNILKSNFSIVVFDSRQYSKQIPSLLKMLEDKKICYLCLSRSLNDIKKFLNENKIDYSGFCFIDVLSSHYMLPEFQNNCIFLDSPGELEGLVTAIENSIALKNCSIILFDTISSLLHYHDSFTIMKLTHNIKSEVVPKNIIKIFLVNKDEILPKLDHTIVKDLSMFADSVIEL